jgi:hypothetical protein
MGEYNLKKPTKVTIIAGQVLIFIEKKEKKGAKKKRKKESENINGRKKRGQREH